MRNGQEEDHHDKPTRIEARHRLDPRFFPGPDGLARLAQTGERRPRKRHRGDSAAAVHGLAIDRGCDDRPRRPFRRGQWPQRASRSPARPGSVLDRCSSTATSTSSWSARALRLPCGASLLPRITATSGEGGSPSRRAASAATTSSASAPRSPRTLRLRGRQRTAAASPPAPRGSRSQMGAAPRWGPHPRGARRSQLEGPPGMTGEAGDPIHLPNQKVPDPTIGLAHLAYCHTPAWP